MSVEKTSVDGVVQLFLNGNHIEPDQEIVENITIGTRVEYDPETWEEVRLQAEYDKAVVGNEATLSGVTVSWDGEVVVDEGGKFGAILMNGGTFSGSGICENVFGAGEYDGSFIGHNTSGAGILLNATTSDGGYEIVNPEDARGAIYLTGSTFSGCKVSPAGVFTGHGGAVEVYGGGVLSVRNSDFSGNSAVGVGAAGGAIAMVEFLGAGEISGSTFSGNSAYFGGAVQQNRGTLTVTDTLFLNNSTSGDATDTYPTGNAGGAIELHQGAAATISGSTFSGNTANSGGAIFNDTFNSLASETAISGCTFNGNTADYQGGAIYNYAEMTVADSVFNGNKVKTEGYPEGGGAIFNTKNGKLTVSGGTFSANSASYGGAIASFVDFGSKDTATLSVENAEITDNEAASGGGIYIMTGTADLTTITNTDFSGNTATSGGGAICQCFGAMTVTGGTFSRNNGGVLDITQEESFSGNPADYFQGGAIAAWDYGTKASSITGAKFDSNTASYGGAISYSYASAPLVVSDCVFTGNGGEATKQGGAVWNRKESTGIVSLKNCVFGGNTAKAGGAIWNAGNMKLESIVLETESDTVYNSGSLAFSGVNTLGAGIINDGKITFSLASGTDALVSDLGAFNGDGSYLLKLSADSAVAGAKLAASAGAFTGSLSVKYDDAALSDVFTLKNGVVGNDLAIIDNGAVLRLNEDAGALSVYSQLLQKLVPTVSNDGSVMVWTDGEYTDGYLVEIAQDDTFGNAIRVATDGTAFDVVSATGAYSCHVAESNGQFTADSASWTSVESAPRQVVSNGNDRADVFFATVDGKDVWSALYQAKNTVTGETASIAGKNRIRDTFSGSESDANILYLSDTDNGDALFMDDMYSEFGEDARLNLIHEIRAGAGDDIVDMTSNKYSAELAGMTVRGGAGDDVLWGAADGNRLFGDAGNDRITGGAGDDVLAGGAGDDVLAGGGGNDVFTFGENWGSDVVSQAAGGEVTLWFESGDFSKWDSASLTYTDGENSVVVSGVAADRITLKFGGAGDDAERFADLTAAGAFLGSTTEAVFETEENRSKGILASL